MIPKHITPEEFASIRYVAGTCDGPADRAIGNLIRSLANDLEQWQNAEASIRDAAADIWDEGFEVGESNGYAIGRDIETSEDTTNPYRASETK